MPLYGRTDLASEAHRLWNESESSSKLLEGVSIREEMIDGINVMGVDILDKRGVDALGKPIGKYYTLELHERYDRGFDYFQKAALVLSGLIRRCADFSSYSRFLIAALGNEDITPDALGPLAASNIIVTSHLKNHSPDDFTAFSDTVLCRTGVLGTTGIESAKQVKILCDSIKPDCVIVVDALAGADISRLCSTIQISNSGIAPGSGVGNNRAALNRESLGVPVIAIGMPTVIDASFISEASGLESMFVTPRDIDKLVCNAGRLIGYGINLALHKGLSLADIDMLIG